MVGQNSYSEFNSQNSFSFSLLLAVAFIISAVGTSTTDWASYINFTLLSTWLFFAFWGNPKAFFFVINKPQAKILFLLLSFYFFTGIYNGGLLYTSKIMGSYLIIFSPFLFFEYYRKINKKKLKVLLYVSITLFFIYVFKALVFYLTHPVSARILEADREAFGEISIGGGYSLAYASTIFAVFLLDILLNSNIIDKRVKAFSIVALFPLCGLVLQTKSTLTIIALFLGIIGSLIFKYFSLFKWNIPLKFFISTLGLLISILFLLLFYKNIGLWIVYFTESSTDIVSLRFRELGYLLSSGFGSAVYLLGRLGLPLISISSFLHNPLIGRGYEYGYVWEESHLFIGQHSEWADMLGNTGIIGFILFWMLIFFVTKDKKIISKRSVPPTYLLTFILLGFFNPLRGFNPMFILSFVIPGISFLLFKTSQLPFDPK